MKSLTLDSTNLERSHATQAEDLGIFYRNSKSLKNQINPLPTINLTKVSQHQIFIRFELLS